MSGCAGHQTVPIRCAPEGSRLYLDGEDLGPPPAELRLRRDRDHVLLFRAPGHRPQLVILRRVEDEAGRRLEPGTVCVAPAPRRTHRSLEVELEEEPPSPP